MANTWQGEFPQRESLRLTDIERTSPVTAFPPNGYGLYDMIGNVWEWTSDWYVAPSMRPTRRKRAAFRKIRAADASEDSYDPCQPRIKIPRKVIKGGSHLCAPNYCRRYRPAARHAEAVDTSTSHVGFRCVIQNRERQMPNEDSKDKGDNSSLKNGAFNRRNMLLASTTIAAASALGSAAGVEKAVAQARSASPAGESRTSSSSWVTMSAGSISAPITRASCPARRRTSTSSPPTACDLPTTTPRRAAPPAAPTSSPGKFRCAPV